MNEATALSIRVCRMLASAFPEDFQRLHGQEMVQTTEDLIHMVAARQNRLSLLLLMLRVVSNFCWRLVVEHAAEIGRDARYAVRVLAGSRGFTIAAVLSIGFGIGMSTSIYSQLASFILRPLPAVSEPDSLVASDSAVSFPVYEAFRDQSGQFSEIAAFAGPVPVIWNENQSSIRIWGQIVTPDYFQVLHTGTRLGRSFAEEEAKPGIAPVAVISEAFWDQHLNRSPDVIGRLLRLNGRTVRVIGVAAEGFRGTTPILASADVWIPTTVESTFVPELSNGALQDRSRKLFSVIGRLQPGITRQQADAKLDAMAKQFENPEFLNQPQNRRQTFWLVNGGRMVPIRDQDLPVVIAIPTVFVGLILLIACANVATMLLAKATARRKEIAVRIALGASRPRLIRQLLTESAILAMLGGVVGYLFAIWYGTEGPELESFVNLDVSTDWTALAFTFGLSLLSGVFVGLIPALQASRHNIVQDLKPGSTWRLGGFRWFSARNVLILLQITASLVLLLITGFVVLGIQRTTTLDPGFDTRNLFMTSLDPVRDGYSTDKAQQFFDNIRERVKRLPGIAEAALSNNVPVGVRRVGATVRLKNTNLEDVAAMVDQIEAEAIGPGFFETIGLPIQRGRTLTDLDKGHARVVINEAMAAKSWPETDPIGQVLDFEEKKYEVVGVAKNFSSGGFMEEPLPTMFRLLDAGDLQRPNVYGVTLIVRGNPGGDVMAAIRSMLAASDSDITMFNVGTVEREIADMIALNREAVILYGSIGLFGLILSAVGLSGVTAYSVIQRTKEIGIRLALGATRFQILRLVTRESFMLIALGTVIGLGAAYGLMQAMTSWFSAFATMTETSATDPILLIGAPMLLALLALVSCYLPARRSMRVSPSVTLREE